MSATRAPGASRWLVRMVDDTAAITIDAQHWSAQEHWITFFADEVIDGKARPGRTVAIFNRDQVRYVLEVPHPLRPAPGDAYRDAVDRRD